ncbi:unnamed protein product [Clonostachys rosea f. rosea IK726]|uniref:Uncharacterized protein n=1 Tax=Clonostachys rosea f. rosea IK726 TaxID=1349383 RepID=A0ACA9US93_BIOOC|nr:unnamed protein product [Clonostachys rosea f. rosea IK726]
MTTTHVSLGPNRSPCRRDSFIDSWRKAVQHCPDDAEYPTRKRAKHEHIQEESALPEESKHRSSDTILKDGTRLTDHAGGRIVYSNPFKSTPPTSTSRATSQSLTNQDSEFMDDMSNTTFQDIASRDSGTEEDEYSDTNVTFPDSMSSATSLDEAEAGGAAEGLPATGTNDDPEIRDGDSALGDEEESTTSWDSEEAERLLRENKPLFDQGELDFAYHVCQTVGKSLCPIEVPGDIKILDVGSGNGTWAIEMGSKYTAATIQMMYINDEHIPRLRPPNVEILFADLFSTWPENEYGFIHIQDMAMQTKSWTKLVKRCYQLLKSGGSLEIITSEPTLHYKRKRLTFAEVLVPEISKEICAEHGITGEEITDIDSIASIIDTFLQKCRDIGWSSDPKDKFLCDAKFTDITTARYRIPLRSDSKSSKEDREYHKEYYRRLRELQRALGLKDNLEIIFAIMELQRMKGVESEEDTKVMSMATSPNSRQEKR